MSRFCNSCKIQVQEQSFQTVEEMEEELNKRMYPKICIGHVVVAVAMISVAIFELVLS